MYLDVYSVTSPLVKQQILQHIVELIGKLN